MKKEHLKGLIREAKTYSQGHDFIDSIVEFYDKRGFITEKQERVLKKVLDNERIRDINGTSSEHYNLLKEGL